MAYSGMPSHYHHWSYGKAYEQPEDPIRSRRSGPALRDGHQLRPRARLSDGRQLSVPQRPHHRARLRPQRLLQEQLHVSPDSRRVHPRHRSSHTPIACAHTSKIRLSASTASRAILDAAHALVAAVRAQPRDAQGYTHEEHRRDASETPPCRAMTRITTFIRPPTTSSPTCVEVPLEPDEDLLLFIRDHNPYLAEWEKDLLTIVRRGSAILHSRRSRPRS